MDAPLVSILLVVRNEKEYLGNCLDSLIRQDYPRESLEFLFVDGCSEDGSYDLLEERTAELVKQGYTAKLLVNRQRILASGWNLGIKESCGEFVCRIDAHSEVGPSYI